MYVTCFRYLIFRLLSQRYTPPKVRGIIGVSDSVGLEWPVVFIPGVYQGSIPHSRAEDVDEERRLLYVAMTRAQSLLYLSFPSKNSKDGKPLNFQVLNEENQKLSVFVEEPTVGRLLATRGGAVDVKGIASILNRQGPSKAEIEKACANMYYP